MPSPPCADTDSTSDDFLSCKAVGGALAAAVQRKEHAPKFPPLPGLQPAPYMAQNGVAPPPPPAEGKLSGSLFPPAAPDGEAPPLPPAPGPAPQPVVQRFKTGPSPQVGSKAGGPAPLPPAMGSMGGAGPGSSYPPHLQPGYPPAQEPLPPSSSSEPTAPPSFSVPAPPTPVVLSPGGATGQAPPPAVTAHTPGPALTHVASGDNPAYASGSTAPSQAPPPAPVPPPQQQQQQPQTAPPPPPHQPMGCGACGCRGSCGGSGHAPPGYFFQPQLARQVFGVPPLFHLTSLCASVSGGGSSYLSQALQSNGHAQLPFFPYPAAGTPLLHAPPAPGDAHLPFGMQQMAAFSRFYPPVFPSVGVVPGASVAGAKKNGSVSCYNCGVSGHLAQDCKQPAIDAGQQGNQRLRLLPLGGFTEAV